MSRPKLAMDTVAQFCDSSDSISFLDCSNNQAAATQRPAVAQRFVSDSMEESTATGDRCAYRGGGIPGLLQIIDFTDDIRGWISSESGDTNSSLDRNKQ